METRLVEYHSYEWGCLVEQGFVTMFVENGLATMLREPLRYRFVWR